MRCPECLKELQNGVSFCPYCGKKIDEAEAEAYQLSIGTILNNRYEIGAVIGYGGFGIVYKAWDDTLKRVVAIKECLPTQFVSRGSDGVEAVVFDEKNSAAFSHLKEEFLAEARNIAQFNTHPNIVHIYDFFSGNGTAYFVMEYLDGRSLRDIIHTKNKHNEEIRLGNVVSIVESLLNALKATHAVNIIHRDIKPSNIIVLRDGTVKLFDFGSARFSDFEKEQTRTMIVTPGYAPPEQYQKKSKQGPFTDIYALGAVIYEMLTGIKPEESINRKIKDEVIPPDKLKKSIPRNLSNAVMRAMAVRPELRFQSADQFLKALHSGGYIRDDKQELKRRKLFRNLMIAGIAIIVLLFGGYVARYYFQRYREAVLAKADIELWAPAMDGLDERQTEDVYREMIAEFFTDYPQINVAVKIFKEQEYDEELERAIDSGKCPDIFDSTNIDKGHEEALGDIEKLLNFSEFNKNDFWFFDFYEKYFIEKKKIPLTFDFPVIYQNTMQDGLGVKEDYKDFISGEANFKGSVDDLYRIQEDMAGSYEVSEDQSGIESAYFTNLWSVGGDSGTDENAAAIRLLYYMLSDNSEEILTIENVNHVPLNKEVFDLFIEMNPDFMFIKDMMPEFRIGEK